MNALIQRAVQKIRKLDAKSDRRRFMRALHYAARGDSEAPPKVFAPKEILELTQISIESQYEHWIVLDRERAIEFLRSANCPVAPESFRKKLSAKNYSHLFHKGPPLKKGNSFVFTYREVLALANETRSLEVPDID